MLDNISATGTMSRHPYFSARESERLKEMGERSYYRLHADSAVQWIRTHPAHFVSLTRERIGFFFFPKSGREHHAPFYFSTLVLALVGLALRLRSDPFVASALALALLAYAAPHFLVQSSSRYSYPVLWIPLLLAGHAVVEIGNRLRGAKKRLASAT